MRKSFLNFNCFQKMTIFGTELFAYCSIYDHMKPGKDLKNKTKCDTNLLIVQKSFLISLVGKSSALAS